MRPLLAVSVALLLIASAGYVLSERPVEVTSSAFIVASVPNVVGDSKPLDFRSDATKIANFTLGGMCLVGAVLALCSIRAPKPESRGINGCT
jgi:hypothetical protein